MTRIPMARLCAIGALALVSAVALAGCTTGSNGNSASSSSNSAQRPGVSGTISGNATVHQPYGNSTSRPGNTTSPRWTSETRSGQVSGLAYPTSQPSATETFTVLANATTLALNVTVQGGDVMLDATPPGCTDSSCHMTTTTSAGAGQVTASAPKAGDWSLALKSTATAGPVADAYTLTIAQQR